MVKRLLFSLSVFIGLSSTLLSQNLIVRYTNGNQGYYFSQESERFIKGLEAEIFYKTIVLSDSTLVDSTKFDELSKKFKELCPASFYEGGVATLRVDDQLVEADEIFWLYSFCRFTGDESVETLFEMKFTFGGSDPRIELLNPKIHEVAFLDEFTEHDEKELLGMYREWEEISRHAPSPPTSKPVKKND